MLTILNFEGDPPTVLNILILLNFILLSRGCALAVHLCLNVVGMAPNKGRSSFTSKPEVNITAN